MNLETHLMRGLRQAGTVRYDTLMPGQVGTVNAVQGLFMLVAGAVHSADNDNLEARELPGIECSHVYLITDSKLEHIEEAMYAVNPYTDHYDPEYFTCYTTKNADLTNMPEGSAVFVTDASLVDLPILKDIATQRDCIIVVCVDDNDWETDDLIDSDLEFSWNADASRMGGDLSLNSNLVGTTT